MSDGLAGVPEARQAPLMLPAAWMKRPVSRLADAEGVEAIFLADSHGRGVADAFSDVDLICVAPQADHTRLSQLWHEALAA